MLNSFHQLHPAFSRQCDDVDEFEFYKSRFETSIAHFQEEYQRFLEANRRFTTGISNDPEIEEVYCYQCVETNRFYKKYERVLIEDAVGEVAIFDDERNKADIVIETDVDAVRDFIDSNSKMLEKYGFIQLDKETSAALVNAGRNLPDEQKTGFIIRGGLLIVSGIHGTLCYDEKCRNDGYNLCLQFIEDNMKQGNTFPERFPWCIEHSDLKPLLKQYKYQVIYDDDGRPILCPKSSKKLDKKLK